MPLQMPLDPLSLSPRQLPLPWFLPLPPPLPPLPLLPLTPSQVWTGLAPPQRAQVRQTLIAVLQEVAGVRDPS